MGRAAAQGTRQHQQTMRQNDVGPSDNPPNLSRTRRCKHDSLVLQSPPAGRIMARAVHTPHRPQPDDATRPAESPDRAAPPIGKGSPILSWLLASLVTAGLILGLTGCQNDLSSTTKPAPGGTSKHGFIAFVGAGRHDPLWPVLAAGAQREILPVDGPTVRYLTPEGDSPRAQAELLRGLRDPDLRGLCIQINDAETVGYALRQMHNRGVPIVSMMRRVPADVQAAHVGLDPTAIGRELARCTVDALGPAGGTIMVLHAGDKDPDFSARYMSFSQTLKLSGSDVAVLGEFDCRGDAEEARRIIRERSERYPRLSAWVSVADWALSGPDAPGDLFRPPTRYITVGGLPHHQELVRDGILLAGVAAEYGEIGGRALRICQSAVRATQDPARFDQIVFVPLRPVTPDTLEDYQRDWIRWLAAKHADSPATPSP